MSAPLVHNLLGDTIGDIRGVLAVIDAAVTNGDGPDAAPYGVHLLLDMVDSALEEVASRHQTPTQGGAAC